MLTRPKAPACDHARTVELEMPGGYGPRADWCRDCGGLYIWKFGTKENDWAWLPGRWRYPRRRP